MADNMKIVQLVISCEKMKGLVFQGKFAFATVKSQFSHCFFGSEWFRGIVASKRHNDRVRNVNCDFFRYRGSGRRPTLAYRFGDSNTPFYTALKEQSDHETLPWEWSDMKSRYPRAKNIINNLCDEKRYEFILTGKFEDVIGKYGLIVVSGLIGRLVG